ncbi:MAG: hypothetical protein H6Q68_1310 [Firmicutes bacterium]|nr:hypothetical protein [Bacillota bacterium]
MSQNHINFGGVGFSKKASTTKNHFINNLPETKRQSSFQEKEELQSAGMIETTNDFTHNHNKDIDSIIEEY